MIHLYSETSQGNPSPPAHECILRARGAVQEQAVDVVGLLWKELSSLKPVSDMQKIGREKSI